jgi:hypothetical protein
VFEATSPQELGGYTYADGNPVSESDPTGLCPEIDCPTRPGPGYENHTPGTTPGKPKKSANTIYAENGESYTSKGTTHKSSNNSNCWPLSACSPPSPYYGDMGDTSNSRNVTPFLAEIKKALKQYWKFLNPTCSGGSGKGPVEACQPLAGTFQIGPLGEEGGFGESGEPAPLPGFAEGGPTSGLGVTQGGKFYDVVSGNKKADADLINIVNQRLRDKGVLPARANAGRASDAEQKFAAVMLRDKIAKADLYINNPSGPCMQRLGCNDVLGAILGNEKQLTVHWPDGNGGWESRSYGGTP